MIPSHFINLEEVPLTPNGKIDINALEEWPIEINLTKEYEAPGNHIERTIIKIWSEVFALNGSIGINHNFFDLGGHSLLAINIIHKIHKELEVEVPILVFFQKPVVKQLAKYVKGSETRTKPSIKRVEIRDHYPASPAQTRAFIIEQYDDQTAVNNQPLILRVEGNVNRKKIDGLFIQLVNRHESLRTAFEIDGLELVQKVYEKVEFKMDYIAVPKDEISVLINDFIRPFSLETAPLLRVRLVKLSKHDHLLMIDLHHIIADGKSIEILMKEFSSLYNGETLPELNVQYKDYVMWHADLMNSETVKKQKQYWLNEFKGGVPKLNLPFNSARADNEVYDAKCTYIRLDKDFVHQLEEVARERQATLFMILLTAYYTLLYKYTGQHEITVGYPIEGRPHADLQNVIGMFINVIALKGNPTDNKTFEEFLSEIKGKTLKAHENQLIQFDDLVKELKIKRGDSMNLLYNTIFMFFNVDIGNIQLQDLKLTRLEVDKNIEINDILIEAVWTKSGIKLNIEYNANLFKQETMHEFKQNFVRVLEAVLKNPEVRLKEIEIMKNM